MTSRNSFWASSMENHKRRVWVWIITALLQILSYVGVLTVYLSRVRMWNAEGIYRKAQDYQNALYKAAQDALGFQDNLLPVLLVLAFVIGMQGFSYLYDQRKVDMYHSVPVDKNRRFLVVYCNGILIYLTTVLASLLIGVISAAAQRAVNGEVMAVVGLGFLWNFLLFLVIYHTVILAVMLTGNRFITLFAAGAFAVYEMLLYTLINNMQNVFFKTKDGFYIAQEPKLSAVTDYFTQTWELKELENVREMADRALPYYGKWFLLAAALLALSWLCYRQRPSEAAGRALSFPAMGSPIKVVIVIPAAMGLGMWVHAAGYGNTSLDLAAMLVAGVIGSAVMEVLYDFDLKSIFRHLLSSGAALAGIVAVFMIFKADLFGYDKYIPAADKVESMAVVLDQYPDFWDEEFQYRSVADVTQESMHIVDPEPILTLAAKSQEEELEDMKDPRAMHVLYRLKSGRKVGRLLYVDFANPVNEELLNRIVGTPEYRNGIFQIMTDQDSFEMVRKMTYTNGATEVAMPVEDGSKLREAYVRDMETFDFTLARNDRPCGEIDILFPNWRYYTLDVYESFENTIAYLQSVGAYYPLALNAEDIDCITVTNYHNELTEGFEDPEIYLSGGKRVYDSDYEESHVVSENFYEEEEIRKILGAVYPNSLSASWHDYREMDDDYDVYITFKKDTSYPYNRSNYGFSYRFYAGQVPQFVAEATALKD